MTGSTEHSGCSAASGRAATSPTHPAAHSTIGRAEAFLANPQGHHQPFAQDAKAVFQPAPALPSPSPRLGLVAGTTVLTADGIIPVEMLCPGDRIVTRNTGLVRLSRLSFSQYDGDFIAITARALTETRPETDTIVPAAQTVLLRGACAQAVTGQSTGLAPAGQLLGMPGVTLHQDYQMTLVQLVFDTPQLVYADGLETLCLADAGDRLAA
ncbi:MAG: Hint domain-containing protein [Rhodobacterales bacterium]